MAQLHYTYSPITNNYNNNQRLQIGQVEYVLAYSKTPEFKISTKFKSKGGCMDYMSSIKLYSNIETRTQTSKKCSRYFQELL